MVSDQRGVGYIHFGSPGQEPPMIWDLHVHLGPLNGMTPAQRMAWLMATADRIGIDRLCLYLGFAPWIRDPRPDQFRKANDDMMAALRGWEHRAVGFAYLNPKHPDESMAELERCVARGPMVGVKLWVAHRCNGPELDPIVRRCAELKAAIFQHTWSKVGGNDPGESTPMDLAALASRHPGTPIICGHTGGDWEIGLRAIRHLPNVWIDTAGSDPTAGFLEMALREVGAQRILYGSDAVGRSWASQLAKVTGAAMTEEERRLILGENLRAMLGPILHAKGMKL
jgi:hypothetical protein